MQKQLTDLVHLMYYFLRTVSRQLPDTNRQPPTINCPSPTHLLAAALQVLRATWDVHQHVTCRSLIPAPPPGVPVPSDGRGSGRSSPPEAAAVGMSTLRSLAEIFSSSLAAYDDEASGRWSTIRDPAILTTDAAAPAGDERGPVVATSPAGDASGATGGFKKGCCSTWAVQRS